MTSPDIDPPADVPAKVIQTLGENDSRQLRDIIRFARQLLLEHPPRTEVLDAREGENSYASTTTVAARVTSSSGPTQPEKPVAHSRITSSESPMSMWMGATTTGAPSGVSLETRRRQNVTDSLFERVVVPVESPDDAQATTTALTPSVGPTGGTVVAVHVVATAGGAPNMASVEQREQRDGDIVDFVTDSLADTERPPGTRSLYGGDVVETIVDAAHDVDATANVFTPRGGNRWVRLRSGDDTDELLADTDQPSPVRPDTTEVVEA